MLLFVNGIGLLAPGLEGWPVSHAVLAGQAPYVVAHAPDPDAKLLPPNERRRSSEVVRWAVQVAEEAVRESKADPRELVTVFASSGGETSILDRICTTLTSPDRALSPTLFHHSVHNAAAGYWCIATGNQQSSTSLACYDSSFGGGLLESAAYAAVEGKPVLLVAYDLAPPPPLYPARPLSAGFAVALVLGNEPSEQSLAQLELGLDASGDGPVTTLDEPLIEALRIGNPAARSLPLLAAIARGQCACVQLDYLEDQRLLIKVTPWPC
jgi:hypothetical protein